MLFPILSDNTLSIGQGRLVSGWATLHDLGYLAPRVREEDIVASSRLVFNYPSSQLLAPSINALTHGNYPSEDKVSAAIQRE
jgi:hypothetical protein